MVYIFAYSHISPFLAMITMNLNPISKDTLKLRMRVVKSRTTVLSAPLFAYFCCNHKITELHRVFTVLRITVFLMSDKSMTEDRRGQGAI